MRSTEWMHFLYNYIHSENFTKPEAHISRKSPMTGWGTKGCSLIFGSWNIERSVSQVAGRWLQNLDFGVRRGLEHLLMDPQLDVG